MDDRFNLRGVQCSTGIHSPLVIVNGPIVKRLGINSGYNCFGQGWRANATIGRAVKLALVNLGGAAPGDANKATFGHPGAYTYCVAENEDANPWEPYHVEAGFSPEDSTVTVFPGEAPHNVMYHAVNARNFLTVLADTMCALGNVQMYVMGDTMVFLGPEHARLLAEAGWRKRDVKQFLFEHARRPRRPVAPGRSGPGRRPAGNASGPSLWTTTTTGKWSRWCAGWMTFTFLSPAAPEVPTRCACPAGVPAGPSAGSRFPRGPSPG